MASVSQAFRLFTVCFCLAICCFNGYKVVGTIYLNGFGHAREAAIQALRPLTMVGDGVCSVFAGVNPAGWESKERRVVRSVDFVRYPTDRTFSGQFFVSEVCVRQVAVVA